MSSVARMNAVATAQVEAYRAGLAIMITLHITHHAGTSETCFTPISDSC